MKQQDLLDLKQRIDDSKEKAAEKKGQLNSLEKELKDTWGCADVKAAEKKIKELDNKVTELNTKIKEGVETLEETYELTEIAENHFRKENE